MEIIELKHTTIKIKTQWMYLLVEVTEDKSIKFNQYEQEREFQKKTSTSALLTVPKLLTVWITTNCGKFFKRWEWLTTLPAS